MHVILLVGQSNMAGRAPLDAGDASPPDARIRVWRDVDGWQPALHPLHRDKPTAGVGPGLAFARAVLSELPAGAVVGLVPAAVGGTAIARWCPRTGDLFHAAVSSTRAALSAATAADGGSRGGGAANDAAGTEPRLAGILWHQGESDAVSAELADAYEPALAALVDTLPPSCGSADAPLILGELGLGFLDASDGGRFAYAPAVNGAICTVAAAAAAQGRRVGVVSARGLGHRGDRLHFNAEAARTLGERYARCWLSLASAARTMGGADAGGSGASDGAHWLGTDTTPLFGVGYAIEPDRAALVSGELAAEAVLE